MGHMGHMGHPSCTKDLGQSRVYWAIKHPRGQRRGVCPKYARGLFPTKRAAWRSFTCMPPGPDQRGVVKRLEEQGYRAVKVRIVEEGS